MSSSRRGLKFWLSTWIPVAMGVAAIALESTEWMGANHTSGPLRWLFQAIFGPVSEATWDIVHHFVRKAGHFTGYGVLSLLWLRAWRRSLALTQPSYNFLLALLATALVASADEFHQTFLPNRTGSAWDVLLDCTGAATLLVATYLYLKLRALTRAATPAKRPAT
jgi:VanZ family protein